MRHLLFPSKAQADAFIDDLRRQGLVQPEVGQTTVNRRMSGTMTGGAVDTATAANAGYATDDEVAEAAGGGAIAGTGVGAAVGAAAGVLGTAATVATGGLALPVILGMTALGSGVGAAVGAIGGAAGAEDTGGTYARSYDVSDEQYERLSSSMNESGRAVAVEESVPADAVEAAAARHGGQFV
ncbi:hypothetical protein F8S09_12370 [Deinococcus sp. SDU3-2]|uniref:Low temperature-induced protein n=1 Tax=Deinococcus terrestris TaxID=2651870 RepID=A0A7X1NX60_9DEIO|nr:hypothetical protein [Deinococcus terrestris]MPY67470.1 hypothetical protein [Deinococcus terrestris]